MDKRVDYAALQNRVQLHNELAEKYRIQVERLREHTEADVDVWEVLLQQMFIQCMSDFMPDGEVPDPVLRAALDFGFQCMGVGAVMAMDGLAQETIVI